MADFTFKMPNKKVSEESKDAITSRTIALLKAGCMLPELGKNFMSYKDLKELGTKVEVIDNKEETGIILDGKVAILRSKGADKIRVLTNTNNKIDTKEFLIN